MAFVYQLTTEEMREKMFAFLKPVYLKFHDSDMPNVYVYDVHSINWNFGVYDPENGIFLTFLSMEFRKRKRDNGLRYDRDYFDHYLVCTDQSNLFSVAKNRYGRKESEIPEQFRELSEIIENGIRFYENENARETFRESLNQEQQSEMWKIPKDLIERCRPSAEICNEQDARKLFETHQCNDCVIFEIYNRRTIADFKKFAPEEKRRVWTGENYTALLKKISGYTAPLSEEQYQQISKDCRDASYLLFVNNMDDSYEELTFTTIQNAWQCGVKSCDYAHLIEKFISKFIETYPEKIENLRPLLYFLDEICSDPEQAKYFENLLFYRKELARLIEHRIWGFQFQLTTEEIREKIFAFLKSDSKCRYILHHALRSRFTLAWACGVYDAQSGIFLTLIHRISDGIARCGKDFYSYLVITDQGDIFKVDRNYILWQKEWELQIPAEYAHFSKKIQEGIQLYWQYSKFEDTLDEQTKKELKNIGKAVTDRCQQMYDSFKRK